MSTDEFPCSLEARISSDYHDKVREYCQRCQDGEGRCLIEFMLMMADEPDKTGDT